MLSFRVMAAKSPAKKGPSKKPKKKPKVPKQIRYTIDEETMDVIVIPEEIEDQK